MAKQFLFSVANWGYRGIQRLVNAASLGARGIIINDANEVLLVEHTYTNGWHLPGGMVDYGESPMSAVVREIREETGLKVTGVPELFAIYTSSVKGAPDYPILYVIKEFEPIPHAKISFEINQTKWFSLHDLPADIQPATKIRLQEYLHNQQPKEFW